MTLARLATARHCASTAFTARGAAHRAGTAAARRLPARSIRVSAARWRPGDGTEDEEAREKAPTEALIDAMDSAAKLRNRDSGGKVTTVMGSDAGAGGLGANMTWKELDERVNEYPSDRKFQAIGEGGDAFVAEVVGLVEGALGRPVDPAQVTSRPSKKGKYVSASVVARWKAEKRWSPSTRRSRRARRSCGTSETGKRPRAAGEEERDAAGLGCAFFSLRNSD